MSAIEENLLMQTVSTPQHLLSTTFQQLAIDEGLCLKWHTNTIIISSSLITIIMAMLVMLVLVALFRLLIARNSTIWKINKTVLFLITIIFLLLLAMAVHSDMLIFKFLSVADMKLYMEHRVYISVLCWTIFYVFFLLTLLIIIFFFSRLPTEYRYRLGMRIVTTFVVIFSSVGGCMLFVYSKCWRFINTFVLFLFAVKSTVMLGIITILIGLLVTSYLHYKKRSENAREEGSQVESALVDPYPEVPTVEEIGETEQPMESVVELHLQAEEKVVQYSSDRPNIVCLDLNNYSSSGYLRHLKIPVDVGVVQMESTPSSSDDYLQPLY